MLIHPMSSSHVASPRKRGVCFRIGTRALGRGCHVGPFYIGPSSSSSPIQNSASPGVGGLPGSDPPILQQPNILPGACLFGGFCSRNFYCLKFLTMYILTMKIFCLIEYCSKILNYDVLFRMTKL